MIKSRRILHENPVKLIVIACPIVKQIDQFAIVGKKGAFASRMRPIGAPDALVGRGRDDCLSFLKKIVVWRSLN